MSSSTKACKAWKVDYAESNAEVLSKEEIPLPPHLSCEFVSHTVIIFPSCSVCLPRPLPFCRWREKTLEKTLPMHPRNRYRHCKPDFAALARKHPPLETQLVRKDGGYATLDFRDPRSQKELTVALLKEDFDLDVDIPLDKLIPTIPQKVNYIHWVEDLLACTNDGTIPKGRRVVGIDVGTGASCVYPLLAHRLNGWSFSATDIEPSSVDWARDNVRRNKMEGSIAVHLVPAATCLTGVVKESGPQFAFSMCNPPFYSSASEEDKGGGGNHGNTTDRTPNRGSPSSRHTGQAHETSTAGGEVAFVQRMAEESLQLRDRVRWYTSMLGKKSSVKKIKAFLADKGVTSVTTTEFIQGKTRRWAIAWTLCADVQVPSSTPSLPKTPLHKALLKSSGFEEACQRFECIMEELKVSCGARGGGGGDWDCRTERATWTGQRRKRRALQALAGTRPPSAKRSHVAGGGVSGQVRAGREGAVEMGCSAGQSGQERRGEDGQKSERSCCEDGQKSEGSCSEDVEKSERSFSEDVEKSERSFSEVVGSGRSRECVGDSFIEPVASRGSCSVGGGNDEVLPTGGCSKGDSRPQSELAAVWHDMSLPYVMDFRAALISQPDDDYFEDSCKLHFPHDVTSTAKPFVGVALSGSPGSGSTFTTAADHTSQPPHRNHTSQPSKHARKSYDPAPQPSGPAPQPSGPAPRSFVLQLELISAVSPSHRDQLYRLFQCVCNRWQPVYH